MGAKKQVSMNEAGSALRRLRAVGAGLALGGLVALGSSCTGTANGTPHAGPAPTSPPLAIQAAPAKDHDFATLYRASATLRGRNTAIITSKTLGFVRRLNVRAGSEVRAGQLLAVLESRELEAGVHRAHAAIAEAEQARAEAEGGIAAAAANLELARISHERSRKLLAADAVSRHDFDRTQAQARATSAQSNMAAARRQAAEARIAQAKAALAEAQANLAYTRITAPFSGRVIEQRIDPGNLASPGTPLLVLEQAGRFRAEASVEEALVGRIEMGSRATVQIDALKREVEGVVTEIVPAVDVGSRAFIVKVELPEELLDEGVQPGLYARVSFPLGARPRRAVPETAIVPWGQLDRLYVVEDGKARARIVTLGERQRGKVEVLSGLEKGELVIEQPPRELQDGRAVRLQTPPTTETRLPAAPAQAEDADQGEGEDA